MILEWIYWKFLQNSRGPEVYVHLAKKFSIKQMEILMQTGDSQNHKTPGIWKKQPMHNLVRSIKQLGNFQTKTKRAELSGHPILRFFSFQIFQSRDSSKKNWPKTASH